MAAKILSVEEIKTKWTEQAVKAFSSLMNSQHVTAFDANLFGDQAAQLICGLNVKLAEVEEIELRRIRASRLKLLGYTWLPEEKAWKSSSDS